jgi:hypothetical protein
MIAVPIRANASRGNAAHRWGFIHASTCSRSLTRSLERFSVCHPERSALGGTKWIRAKESATCVAIKGSTRSDAAPCGFAKLCIVAISYIDREFAIGLSGCDLAGFPGWA